MKLGLQGFSVVFSSGDSGVAGPSGEGGNADGCLGPGGNIFNPDFPATCPYITSVGATYLPPGADVKLDAEVAVTRFASGVSSPHSHYTCACLVLIHRRVASATSTHNQRTRRAPSQHTSPIILHRTHITQA